MIWTAGRIVPDDALLIPALDRAFEHGLGLFETLRTWNGHPALLPRHLERLQRSAAALGIPLDPVALPDAEAVRQLVEASNYVGVAGPEPVSGRGPVGETGSRTGPRSAQAPPPRPEDAVLRITLTGGRDESGGSVLWMRSASLPGPTGPHGARVRASWRLTEDDELLEHKTLNYWRRRRLYEKAREAGFDEDLGVSDRGLVFEGTRTSLFAVFGGTLQAPGTRAALPGVMRSVVLEWARRLGIPTIDGPPIPLERLAEAHELFLTNSVRGMIPVGSFTTGPTEGTRSFPVPGPLTRRLQEAILPWLLAGGGPLP
jgi:branched-subunit amino acid aminotransferase/4-amino-4-deoxychorismate lyase